MNNIKEKENFRRLMDTYKLSDPLSVDSQKYIVNSQKRSLKELLKRKGTYRNLLWLVILIIIAMRRFGLHLSMLQGKIIVGVIIATISTGSVAGAYQVGKYVLNVMDTKDSVTDPDREREADGNAGINCIETEPINRGGNTDGIKNDNNDAKEDTAEMNDGVDRNKSKNEKVKKKNTESNEPPLGNILTL